MSIITGIQHNQDGDLLIKRGTFVHGDTQSQEIGLILTSAKGQWKQNPLVGVDIIKWLNAPFSRKQANALEREIEIQLQYDNFKTFGTSVTENNLEVEGER